MTSPSKDAVLDGLRRTKVLAIVRSTAADLIPGIVETLVEAGICAVEIALAGPGTVSAIRAVSRRNIPGLLLGAGTVLDTDAAGAVLEAGAGYFITPAVLAEVIRFAAERELAVFPGAYTPTEILTATRLGATAVKLFPASAGGPGYLKALLAPLPSTQLIPTGGVTLDAIPEYLGAGAMAVAIGSPLIRDADTTGDLRALAARAQTAVHLANGGSLASGGQPT
jgi:2-dehydro-3-deoxyphosphogluconate aldolase / (4S)-4-hydroxy-2-oxoglutarate aldolase